MGLDTFSRFTFASPLSLDVQCYVSIDAQFVIKITLALLSGVCFLFFVQFLSHPISSTDIRRNGF